MKLATEHHIHLYGCLSAEDLHEIGKESRRCHAPRLDWYACEYEKAYGKKPIWQEYWSCENGLQKLKRDFLFLEKSNFQKFQASFNLIISLCKIEPDDTTIIRRVFKRLRKQGIKYAEARTLLPPYIQGDEINKYFSTIAQETLRIDQEYSDFTPRLALSVPREAPHTDIVYCRLRDWMDHNQELAKAFTGIDLAFYEENDPPKNKKNFCAKVLEDNFRKKHKLAILYHVGESFRTISAASSARWVWEVANMGAHRLGHAISLGVEPLELLNRSVNERVEERADHLNWLLENEPWLADSGYEINLEAITSELKTLAKLDDEEKIHTKYSHAYVEDLRKFQNVLIQDLKRSIDPVIECCPSSNSRIAMIDDFKNHPLKRFLDADLKVCISTDDPGIFDTNLAQETEIAWKQIGVSHEQLEKICQQEFDYRSDILASRLESVHQR